MVNSSDIILPLTPTAIAAPSVLLVGNFLSASGGSRGVCEELAERLSAAGWSVLTTSQKRGRMPRLFDMLSTAWRRRAAYDIAQVDVYSGPAFFWAEAACWTLRRANKSYILTLHGGNLPTFARRWPGRVRRLLQSASVVTAPSTYLQQQMRPYRPDIRLLPNPLELSSYSFRPRSPAEPRLLWLRAFHGIYNPSLAVEVLARIRERYPSATLTMVGPDKGDGSFQETQRRLTELGLEDAVHFPGGVPKAEVPQWMAKGDVFLNTTNVDNTPVSVIEAMACGLCVVSTDVDGVPYLVEHERDALLAPPRNAEAMAEAVSRILDEPELARSLSSNARRKVEQFDWEVILPGWEGLLREVASEA